MAITIEELRALGATDVTLTCGAETYDGRVVADKIGERAVNFLFAPSDTPDNRIVIALEDVSSVVRR